MTLLDRLTSYANWNSHISSSKLAANGFLYTGITDTVECVCCHVCLSDWKEEDDIQQRHYDPKRPCDFHLLLPADKPLFKQLHSDTLLQEQRRPFAQLQKYESEDARLSSYSNWPDFAPLKPPTLARAGLFYTGVEDKVKCPFCLGSMYNWEKGDNPFSEHAKNFKDCPFITCKLFESLNISKASVSKKDDTYNTSCFSSVEADGSKRLSDFLATCPTKGTFDGHFRNIVNAVEIVIDLGYTGDIIEAAIQRIPNFKPHKTLETEVLLDAVFEVESSNCTTDNDQPQAEVRGVNNRGLSLEAEEEGASNWLFKNETILHNNKRKKPVTSCSEFPSEACRTLPTSKAQTTQNRVYQNEVSKLESPVKTCKENTKDQLFLKFLQRDDNVTNCLKQNPKQFPAFSVVPKSKEIDPKLIPLLQERNALVKSSTCVVCLKRKVGILNLPCRHMVFCRPCAGECTHCMRCEKAIIATVKIYLP